MLTTRQMAEVADAFGLGPLSDFSGPTARGEQGQMFRLETATGSWAIKELFGGTGGRDIREAAAFHKAAEAAGVPVPHLLESLAGDIIVELGDTRLRAYEWIDLRDPDPFVEPHAVGEVVAAMHRIEFSGSAPVDPWYVDPVGAERWRMLERELTAAGAPFASDFAGLRPEFVALEALLTPPRNLRTCHRDLFADNLRATEAGSLCVIDWDDCGLADPVQELCLVLVEFGRSTVTNGAHNAAVRPLDGSERNFDDEHSGTEDRVEFSRATVLYQAYLDAGGPGRVTGPGDFSMVIAQLGHITERGAARWLAAAPGDPERARMVSLFDEVTSYPLTRSVIDHILEALPVC